MRKLLSFGLLLLMISTVAAQVLPAPRGPGLEVNTRGSGTFELGNEDMAVYYRARQDVNGAVSGDMVVMFTESNTYWEADVTELSVVNKTATMSATVTDTSSDALVADSFVLSVKDRGFNLGDQTDMISLVTEVDGLPQLAYTPLLTGNVVVA